MSVVITTHAHQRWRERKNLTYKISIGKFANQAIAKGTRAEEFHTEFREYLEAIKGREYFYNNQYVIVYKNFIFIFADKRDGTTLLVTIFEIPNRFAEKNFSIMK